MKSKIIAMLVMFVYGTIAQTQQIKINILMNGIKEKERYDVLVIDHNRNSVDSILGVSSDFLIFLEYWNIYELRFRHSEKYSINKIIVDVNNEGSGPIAINVNLVSVSRFSIREISEGILYFNRKIYDWQICDPTIYEFK